MELFGFLVWNMDDGTIIIDSTSFHSYTNEGIYNAFQYLHGDFVETTTIYQTFNFNTDSSLAVAYAPQDTILCTTAPFSLHLVRTELIQFNYGILETVTLLLLLILSRFCRYRKLWLLILQLIVVLVIFLTLLFSMFLSFKLKNSC